MLELEGSIYPDMTLKEHIDDIRDKLKEKLFTNEAAVSQGIVLRLLHVLDWPIFNTQIVTPEYTVEKRRVDFALCSSPLKPVVFIEVKQVGNLEGAEEQLFEYAYREGVPIAILTDGQKWQFFYPIGQGNYRERKVHELNLTEDDNEINATRLNRYLNHGLVRTRKSIKTIEDDYKQKKIQESLPEAWSELVEKETSFGTDVLAEAVENLCGYKPNRENVLDFLKSLKSGTESDNRTEPDNGEDPLPSDPSSRNPGLFVTMPNGDEVNHNVAATTFTEVIEKLGIERVRNLGYKVNRVPLISTSEHSTYDQRKSGRYYIMTNTSTKKKKSLLEKIATDLGEPLRVEIVD